MSSKVNLRKCGTERKMRKLKSIVIPVEHKNVSDEKSKTINDISELDEIAVTVHAAEDDFMSDEDPGLEEEIYPIQEEDEPHVSEPIPGTSGGRMETTPRFDLREYRNDPVFKEMVNMAVAEQLKQDKQVSKGMSGTLAGNARESIGEENPQIQNIIESAQMPQTPCNQSQPKRNNDAVKSPSDTTIYAPALARNPVMGGQEKGDDLINQISDFVAKMRIQSTSEHAERGDGRSNDGAMGAVGGVLQEENAVEQARDVVDRMIIDAEKFHAAIEKPSGTLPLPNLIASHHNAIANDQVAINNEIVPVSHDQSNLI